MRRISATSGSLTEGSRGEFTNVGVNPALDRFQDLARQLRREVEEQARRHGREFGAPAAIAPPKAA